MRPTVRCLAALLLLLAGCRTATVKKTQAEPPRPGPSGRIAVTAAAQGAVVLLDRADLRVLRRELSERGAPGVPMPVIEDPVRHAFYVANFNGGLARVDPSGPIEAIDLGGSLGGLAIAPDGKRLAATGASDLAVHFVDLEVFRPAGQLSIGQATDSPKHPLTHGLSSPHPLWLDATHLLAVDDVHEELVIVDAGGPAVVAHIPMPGPVHHVLTGEGQVMAIVEDPPQVVIFGMGGQRTSECADCVHPSLISEGTVRVPLAEGEPVRLHHAVLTPGGGLLAVANAGPPHGPAAGRTVVGIDLADGTVLWTSQGPAGAGHLAWLGDDRLAVIGHRAAEVAVIDASSGKRVATWPLPEGAAPGHALAAEPHDRVLLVDEATGRVLRVARGGVVAASDPIGAELEASF